MMPSPQQFDEAESDNDPLAHLSEFHQGFFEAREMLSDPEPAMSQGEIDRRAEAIVDAIVESQSSASAAEDQQQSQSTLQQELIEATKVSTTDTGTPPQLNVHTAEPDMRFGEWYPGKEFPTVQTVVMICGGVKRDEDVREYIHRYADPDLDCVVIDNDDGGYAQDFRDVTVRKALAHWLQSPFIILVIGSPPCRWTCALRGIGYDENSWATPSGPGVLFNEDFPDGIVDEAGVKLPEAQEAIKFWMAFFTLVRVAHKSKAEVIIEQPVSRGRHSLFAIKKK